MTTNLERTESPDAADALPFAPDSAIRRVHKEGVLLLGGGRALLMQLSHPTVAKGVAEHSNYAHDRWGRLLRTLRPMYAVAFGTAEQARAAGAGVNRQHERVRGEDYEALDPSLLLWVLATLIDTSLDMHARFLRPLTQEEAEAYYADMRCVGELLCIPSSYLPRDFAAFREYFDAALADLRVSDEARAIVDVLIQYNPLTASVILPSRFLTAGTLPAALREQFGLPWGPKSEASLHRLEAISRATLLRLPLALRRTPWFLMPQRP
jgi:uncharacterized protein (DUF2236 family)